MPKKVVSFALSESSISEIDKTSKALGMSRSELIDFLAQKGFHFPEEVKGKLDEISELQKQAKEKIKKK
jgi:predicted DNA-binding transcriptional regulator AlpA